MTYFTDEDAKKLAELPESEQAVFIRRFAEIQMRIKIADDTWDKTREEIGKELDKLVEDIHKRLDSLSQINECGGIGTEPYHPNRSDYPKPKKDILKDAYAQPIIKVQDRKRPAVILETSKEGKGGK